MSEKCPTRFWFLVVSLFWVPGTVTVGGAADDVGNSRLRPIRALAPVEIAALGVDASSVAAEPGGSILIIDRDAGTLLRIDAPGRRRVLLNGLRKPTGLAIDANGGVLVLDQNGRRLLRLAADRVVTVISSTLRQARAIAVGPGGQTWVSMRRATGRDRDDDDDRESEYVIARLDAAGMPTLFASGFVDVQGLAADARGVYVSMARLATDRGRLRTTLARISLRANGSAGPVEPLLRDPSQRHFGIAIDAVGDVFITATSSDDNDHRGDDRGIILKRRTDGVLSTFAKGLRDPMPLAFAPSGDLLVAEQDKPGRLLRFVAPQVQATSAPAFTNETPLVVRGTAPAGARVVATAAATPGTPIGSAVAGVSGAFAVRVPLDPNVPNTFTMVATGAGGAGLVGTPLPVEIVHDDILPSLMLIEPMAGVHTRGPLSSTARAEDERSGVTGLTWSVDGVAMAQLMAPVPGQPFTGSTVLPTAALVEGPHGIEVVAADRAGNRRTAGVPLVVDRTPPDTLIVGGPSAEIAARTTTFTVSGTDVWSAAPQLDYAWRLDIGPWSAFNALAEITLSDLLPGAHRFEVRARDRAGNEDATPAAQTFVVRSLRIRILEPAAGTVVTTDSVWVRASVEGGTGEVVVSVPLPAQFGVPAVAAPVQGGTVALHVPVDPAFATLTLIATDASGATAQADVSIVVTGAAMPEPRLELWPPGGLAPLNVRIGLRGWSGSAVTIDIDGDGTNEFDGQLDADDVSVTYERAGVYVPTVRMTTPEGEILTRRGVVEVYDRAVLDARLQAVWSGFKDALRGASVETAIDVITAERRAAWADYFSTVPPDAFADVDLVFTDMTLVEVGAGAAQYEMLAERDGLLYSYAVWFRVDADGRWRLWQF